ncbi:MAG: serine/threonine-protein phosphatase [Rhodanobacter sp.]|nr:MAG: serine/threonine-protein phosphatase [Rhodanobacter sp.]
MIEFGHGTHVGMRRTRNEDTYYADASLGLFLVADGMGGHEHGEVASALVRDVMVERVTGGSSLNEAVFEAAKQLAERSHESTDPYPMGTTIAAVRLNEWEYEAAWVGDSRIYLYNQKLRQLSHDHSLVQALVEAGRLDPARAARHPQRNVLTQALGVTGADHLHLGMAGGKREQGLSFLICSDGLSENVSDTSMARIVSRTDLSAQECVDHLLLDALDHGGDDNITTVLVRLR